MLRRLRTKTGRDYALTFVTEFIVLLAGVAVYKFAAKQLGETGFSEYAIVRRTVSFIQPLLIIGLGVGIPRYVAFASVDNSQEKSGAYFISGFLIIEIITIFFLAIFNILSSQFSFWIFGNETFSFFIPYMSLMIFGVITHSIVYSYLRGKIKMGAANTLQLLNLGIIPICVFSMTNDIKDILLFTGIIWTAVSIIFLIAIFITLKWNTENIISHGKELLLYGIQRVPGDVALAGFLALPAYFTAHLIDDNLKTAGFVAFGMSLLNMAGAAFGPICLLLLPQASKVIATKDFSKLKIYSNRIALLTLMITVFALLIFELFTKTILQIYLGETSTSLILCVRIIMFACVGYSIYISLRSILDAYYVKAINTKNIFISFIVFIIPSLYIVVQKLNFTYILFVFIGSMSLLGFLTYLETKKIFFREIEE